jgi:hypothetical protein
MLLPRERCRPVLQPKLLPTEPIPTTSVERLPLGGLGLDEEFRAKDGSDDTPGGYPTCCGSARNQRVAGATISS